MGGSKGAPKWAHYLIFTMLIAVAIGVYTSSPVSSVIIFICALCFLPIWNKKNADNEIVLHKFSGPNAEEDAAQFLRGISPDRVVGINGMDLTSKVITTSDPIIQDEYPPHNSRTDVVDLSYRVHSSQKADDFYRFLKEATAYKKQGKMDLAVISLEKARSLRHLPDVAYMAEYEIKYANYLQAAGRNDDGWRVLNNARTDNGFQFGADQARICDAMRLFLQREGKNDQAIECGISALILNVKHNLALYGELKEQGHAAAKAINHRLADISSKNGITKEIKPLLKKAKRESLELELLKIAQDAIVLLPAFNEYAVSKRVQALINEDRVK